jgi:phosphoribosylanthranilate isomerase
VAHRAPRIKFCGITSLADAELAVANGAWAIGLILWPGSKRAADPAEAAMIARQLRRKVEIAGVFVNQSLDEVERLADTVGLSLIQLHGDEGPSYAVEIARRTGAKVIKAQSVRLASDILSVQAFRTDFHLLDTHREGQRGGTGETFDWDMVGRHRTSQTPLILSGGLGPDNVVAGIEAVRPFAVDVASGVESSPGVKDPEKMKAFAEAVRSTADDGEEEPAPRPHPSERADKPAPPAGRRNPVRRTA